MNPNEFQIVFSSLAGSANVFPLPRRIPYLGVGTQAKNYHTMRSPPPSLRSATRNARPWLALVISYCNFPKWPQIIFSYALLVVH